MNRFRWIFFSVVASAVSALLFVSLNPILTSSQRHEANPRFVTEKAGLDAYIDELSGKYSAPLSGAQLAQNYGSSNLSNAALKDTCWLLYFESHIDNCRITIDFRT